MLREAADVRVRGGLSRRRDVFVSGRGDEQHSLGARLRKDLVQKRTFAVAPEAEVDNPRAPVDRFDNRARDVEQTGGFVVAVNIEGQEPDRSGSGVLERLAQRRPKRVHHRRAMSHLIGVEAGVARERKRADQIIGPRRPARLDRRVNQRNDQFVRRICRIEFECRGTQRTHRQRLHLAGRRHRIVVLDRGHIAVAVQFGAGVLRGRFVFKSQPVSVEAVELADHFCAKPFGQRVDAFLRAGFERYDQFVGNRFGRRGLAFGPAGLNQLRGLLDRIAINEQFGGPVGLREQREIQFPQ